MIMMTNIKGRSILVKDYVWVWLTPSSGQKLKLKYTADIIIVKKFND